MSKSKKVRHAKRKESRYPVYDKRDVFNAFFCKHPKIGPLIKEKGICSYEQLLKYAEPSTPKPNISVSDTSSTLFLFANNGKEVVLIDEKTKRKVKVTIDSHAHPKHVILHGKKINDKITINGKEYTIKEIK